MKIITSVALLLFWGLFLYIHYLSVYVSAYPDVWWLDILMHTWGGFLVVTTWYQVKVLNAFALLMSQWWLQPFMVLSVMMIVWELFEYKYGLVTDIRYLADTTYDILCGFSGGLISVLMFSSRTINE